MRIPPMEDATGREVGVSFFVFRWPARLPGDWTRVSFQIGIKFVVGKIFKCSPKEKNRKS